MCALRCVALRSVGHGVSDDGFIRMAVTWPELTRPRGRKYGRACYLMCCVVLCCVPGCMCGPFSFA